MTVARGVFVALTIAAVAAAQAPQRRAANITALLTFSAYYHGRPVVLIGQVTTQNDGQVRVSDGQSSVHLVFSGSAPDGNDEIRGEFWDLARMKPDDPRLASLDLWRVFCIDPPGAGPRAGGGAALMGESG